MKKFLTFIKNVILMSVLLITALLMLLGALVIDLIGCVSLRGFFDNLEFCVRTVSKSNKTES